MKRANVNYWVDTTMGVAFVVCAVSGTLFLLPSGWWTSVAMLGLPAATWHTLHDWSGVLMTAAVAGHLVLHWRWAWKMTRRTFADSPATAGAPSSCREAVSPSRVPDPVPIAAASTDGRSALGRYRAGRRLYDRKDFLGAALAAGAVAFVGFGLLTREPSSSGAGSNQTASVQKDDWSNEDSGTADAASDRVTVDASRCTGCGHCLSVCPDGVFAWDGGTASAVSPDACRLCGRCLQVCGPRAITLSA